MKKLFAYISFSMGGQQAYHMSALFPDFVDNKVRLAGSARTSWHALTSSSDFHDGHYKEQPKKGLKAFDRVYSTWALCREWFREKSLSRVLGCV